MTLRRSRPAAVLTATAGAVLLATFSRGFSMARPNLTRLMTRPVPAVSSVIDAVEASDDRVAVRLPFRASQPRMRLRPHRRGGPPRADEPAAVVRGVERGHRA